MNPVMEFIKHQDEALARQGKTKQQRIIIYASIGGGALIGLLALFWIFNSIVQSLLHTRFG